MDTDCATDLAPVPDADDAGAPRACCERGQGMVEYAFILMLVFLVVLLSVQILGHQTQNLYSNIQNGFNGH